MGINHPADHDDHGVQLCRQVQEEHSVEDVGTFTAFQDGSIHVSFDDRALLYMQAAGMHCDVITPEGKRVRVAVQNPLGVEQYVHQAAEFAAWASSSPVQRSQLLQTAAAVKKETNVRDRLCSVIGLKGMLCLLVLWIAVNLSRVLCKFQLDKQPLIVAQNKNLVNYTKA